MKIVYTHSAGIARGCRRYYIGKVAEMPKHPSRREVRAAAGVKLDGTQVQTEALANWIGQNLFKNGFARAVVSGDANTGNWFVRVIDKVRRATMSQKNNPSASDVAMLERLFMQAVENKQGPRDGETEFAITEAFVDENGVSLRTDILQALNRMSSMLYILMIREKAGK